uniref:Uncharacterized protein n=1 Tax=Anguilla anguilla TaxID=7936 RepID=A0A0E9VJ69_ANGAN
MSTRLGQAHNTSQQRNEVLDLLGQKRSPGWVRGRMILYLPLLVFFSS